MGNALRLRSVYIHINGLCASMFTNGVFTTGELVILSVFLSHASAMHRRTSTHEILRHLASQPRGARGVGLSCQQTSFTCNYHGFL